MFARRARWIAPAGLVLAAGLVTGACGGGAPSPLQTGPGSAQPSGPAAGPTTGPSGAAAGPGAIGPSEITGSLQGTALVRALRAGGLLLWMRHTERDTRSGVVTPQQAASHDCAAQSELTPTGRQHAEQIGSAMRALRLPITAVHTARLCRTLTTGRLLRVAPVSEDARLDASSTWVNRGGAAAQQRATLQVLSEAPPAGTDLVLVSSALDIPQPQPEVLRDLGPGEVAVFRPGPPGKATLLARIGELAWPALLQAAGTTSSAPPR